VNDHLVYEAATSPNLFDVTPFVHKGKNTATFELRPTCLVPDIGEAGPLVVGIAPGHVHGHTVDMTEPSQAEIEIDPKRDTDPKTIRRTFRVW